MAIKSIISNTKLDALAQAIATKGGGTLPMTVDEMTAAVDDISPGISLTDFIDDTRTGTITISDNDATTVRKNFWRDGGRLEAISFPAVKIVKENAFYYATHINSVYLPACEEIKNNGFYGCDALTSITLPSIKYLAYDVFDYCKHLITADLGPNLQQIQGRVFQYCTGLTTVIIRNTSAVVTLGSSVFYGTPIESGTGFIYVPDALVSQYQAATNWSAYASKIKGLSELPT